ncbi:hypothetical protein K0M31_009235 [Melipona bicolor]|uniref:Uncharacterized protein n=1 Tax=Melipona bicolor TaxID=60889 RepID=A0AA40FP73_9HYME|nr:hypothetical protein K0M31_009235 [Melipona bicolor]
MEKHREENAGVSTPRGKRGSGWNLDEGTKQRSRKSEGRERFSLGKGDLEVEAE